jgi:diguanylate cyclase (GGDEF)-like protein
MLEFISNYDISLFVIVTLGTILISISYRGEVFSYSNRLIRMIIMNLVLINTLEILSWVFEGLDGQLFFYLNYVFNFLLILLTPAIPAFIASYFDYKIYGSVERIRQRRLYLYGFGLGAILLIVNFFTPVVFSISSENMYQREPFLWFNLAYVFLLILHSFLMAFKNRNKIKSSILIVVVLLLILPATAAMLQMLYLGLIVMWPTLSFVVIVIYLSLETASAGRDYLTGLNTRVRLDEYIQRELEKESEFTLMFIDLDNFKTLNDTLGHVIGDQVLLMFSKVLRSVFKDDFVSRYGGDEFFVVIHEVDPKKIEELRSKLKEAVKKRNEQVKEVKFSMGYASTTLDKPKTYLELLTESDNSMYKQKAINKNYKRRKSDR